MIKSGQADANRLIYLEWVEQYLIQQGVKDKNIWRSLRSALFPYRHPYMHRLKENYRYLMIIIKKILKKMINS